VRTLTACRSANLGAMPTPWSIRPRYSGENSTKALRWTALADLVSAQHGVVARRQLLQLGFTSSAIEHWLAAGYLLRIYRGVYAVGRADLRREGHFLAAVLACGQGAALSHLAAAAHRGLLRSSASRIDVTVAPRRRVRPHPRIRAHRARLDPADVVPLKAIPTTSVERTLLDLADVVAPERLREAFEQTHRLRVFDLASMRAVLERSPGRRGLRVLNALLAEGWEEPPELRSGAERELLELIRAAGLPLPVTNTYLEGILVDACWPRHRLVVEIDSYAYHSSPGQFETDHERTEVLQRAGCVVIRFTARRLRRHPGAVIAAIRGALDRAIAA
jgi:very-short-patch-repair endonuclease